MRNSQNQKIGQNENDLERILIQHTIGAVFATI